MRDRKPEAKRYIRSAPAAGTDVAANSTKGFNLDTVAQGDGADNRTGNKIRIFTLKVNYMTFGPFIDVFLVLSSSKTPPSHDDFVNVDGGTMIKPDKTYRYKLLRHAYGCERHDYFDSANPPNNTGFSTVPYHGKFSVRFPGGLLQSFDGPSGGDQLRWTPCLVFVNQTAEQQSVSYCSEIRYTDV